MADLSRQLQVLALQRAQSDRHRQREGPQDRLDPRGRPLDARRAVHALGEGRHPLLLGLLQQGLRAQGRHRRGALVLRAQAKRGPHRAPNPLALQPRHGDERRQALYRHRRRPPLRARPEQRQGRVGDQADQLREADRRLHRRAPRGQGQGDHRRPGRRVAGPRPDLRHRRQDRPENMGIPDGCGNARGHEDLGERDLAHGRRRRLDARHL